MSITGSGLFADKRATDPSALISPVPIAKGGTGAANASAARSNLGITPANIGAARIEVKTYVGTGTIGQSTPTSVTFSFTPKLVWIAQADYRALMMAPVGTLSSDYTNGLREQALLMYGAPTTKMFSNDHSGSWQINYTLYLTWSGNTVEWYSNADTSTNFGGQQLNKSGATYYALAIG